ncbi:hypothetical protein [Asticcacaulis sp. AC460]|uniref:hypothetical protein n=1 Tax=Asticcacaulis sp. AC460 TaxID=1282360 RepID=UPI000404625E|nr:hypothetical protein [Asticcacaulis sp. AC460]
MKVQSLVVQSLAWCLVAAVAFGGTAQAAGRKKELNSKASYTQVDAVKGQGHVTAAMTTPMLELLQKADVQHPEYMLQYGLALDLGRPSEAYRLAQPDKERLKKGYRELLDLYITSKDKFDIEFNEDAMLDESEFWIYLAKHVGRRKNQEQTNASLGMGNDPAAGSTGFFVPQTFGNDDDTLNLNQDLILKPGMVNAATTCAQSANAFARMEKAQKVDIAATKLTPDQFAKVQQDAVRVYQTSYQQGVLACGGRDFFNQTVDFSRQNLGLLGTLQENPAAILATIAEPDEDKAE